MSFDHAGRATVYEKRRLNGAFFEYMELNQFPFDSQVGSSWTKSSTASLISIIISISDDNSITT